MAGVSVAIYQGPTQGTIVLIKGIDYRHHTNELLELQCNCTVEEITTLNAIVSLGYPLSKCVILSTSGLSRPRRSMLAFQGLC